MKVKCISTSLNEEQRKELNVNNIHFYRSFEKDITLNKYYTVLALTFYKNERIFGTDVYVHIVTDDGLWKEIPVKLFDIVEGRVSKCWIIKEINENAIALWPESFFKKYYFDDLTAYVPEIVSDFKEVCELLEEEFSEINYIINSEEKVLVIEHLYTVENYFTFNVKVKSGEFAGASSFCISKEKLINIVETLSVMHKELKGQCEINDGDSDSFVIIEMDRLGHVDISGQIGGSYEDHFMKFKFSSDQTILMNFLQTLKILL